MYKITVVIPNYNGINYLKGCLEALCAQESGTPEFEVLVVDNASGDGSVEQARELAARLAADRGKGCGSTNTGHGQADTECGSADAGHGQADTECVLADAGHGQAGTVCVLADAGHGQTDTECDSADAGHEQADTECDSADAVCEPARIRIIRLKKNTGFCHAVNVGIRKSTSPYIILLNNDTKVMPAFIKSLYRAIERDPKIFSVSAKMLMWDRSELLDDAGDCYHVLGWAYAVGKGKPAADYNVPRKVFSACGGAAIYRRSILEEIGLFDEKHFAYLEDLDIGYRARIHGYHNLYEPKAQVLHFGSASTGSRYNEFKTRLAAANNVYVVYKNMPMIQLIWNLPFLMAGFFIKWLFFCHKRMGKLYLLGLWDGLRKCLSAGGRARRVRFQNKNLANYLRIQLELYWNLACFFRDFQ